MERALVHEVTVRCSCEDIEQCIVVRYMADVRALWFELERLRGYERTIEGIWGAGLEVLKAS